MKTRSVIALSFAILALGLRPSIAQDQVKKALPGPIGTKVAVKPLDADPRLNVRVTISRKLETVAKSLALLSKLTNVKLQTTDAEISGTMVSFHYKVVSLRDVCDSIAALHGWRWKLDERKTWLLCPSSQEVDNLRPHSDAEAELYRLGHQFLRQFADLPADVQAAMWHDSESGKSVAGVPLDDLPASVQDTVNSMIDTSIIDRKELGVLPPFSLRDQSSLRVSMQGMRHADRDNYSISVGFRGGMDVNGGRLSGGSMSVSDFQVFHDANEDYHVVPRAQIAGRTWLPEKEDAQSRKEAIKSDPRLQVKMTMNGENATLSQVMQELAPVADIAYMLNPQAGKAVRKTFHFVQLPVYEILDRLCVLYDFKSGGEYGYCWGRRESGVIVFHVAPVEALAIYRGVQADRK